MCPDLPTKRDFYKRSVSRHNFHRHLIAISVDLNGSYVCVIIVATENILSMV